ncbi:MAG TPA: hypothetical protein VEV42_17765, partial [Pyrinomonadaceae bacterium]|nr:hypothetical protein [Pyrinomonadaceae bacterium]
EKNAYRLLEQVIDEAQSLRLTENRVRIQTSAADLLWDQNQGRARGLFMMAAEGVAELGRTSATTNRRGPAQSSNEFFGNGFVGQPSIRVFQLRQELVLAAARHDAPLAYQLLAATKPPAPTQNTSDPRAQRIQVTSEDNLEQTLLAAVAARDPKLAAQNAEQMMEKGQFPRTIGDVINQLQHQDAEAADKLADRTVKRLLSANLLTSSEAATLAQTLLAPGPRPPASETKDSTPKQTTTGRAPVLPQSTYVDLLSSVVDAALKFTPSNQSNQRGTTNPRVRAGSGIGPGVSGVIQSGDAATEQNNARRLLVGLQPSLSLLDQYLPAKAAQVRQKLAEAVGNNSVQSLAQTLGALQGNVTADSLVQAAASAPQQMQARLYQQAAFKALDEGDTERARQIANEHLQNNARDAVMQRIDFRELTKKAEGARIEDIRQMVARLQSDNEKINLLIQLAGDAQKTNSKMALQLLDEAKQIAGGRATGYDDFDQQLRVAHAFATIDPARSFEILEPGISQLNELLSAAAVLSGFEVNMFRDGEMAMQGGNGLTATINRYGQELAVLARSDFDRSEALAGRFQFAEPRIMARMAIVQGLLGVRPVGPNRVFFGNVGENVVIRQN